MTPTLWYCTLILLDRTNTNFQSRIILNSSFLVHWMTQKLKGMQPLCIFYSQKAFRKKWPQYGNMIIIESFQHIYEYYILLWHEPFSIFIVFRNTKSIKYFFKHLTSNTLVKLKQTLKIHQWVKTTLNLYVF